MGAESLKTIRKAYRIAVRDFKSNYGIEGIYAGPRNHSAYWARDGLFATLGSCALRDFEMARRNLNLYANHQKDDGQIPLKVEDKHRLLHQLFHITWNYDPPKVHYKSSQIWCSEPVVDTSALFIIAACEYVKKSRDKRWLKRNKEKLVRSAEWLQGRKNGLGLIDEGVIGSFADQTLKSGSVMYTNACVWKAWSDLADLLDDDGFAHEAHGLEQAIHEHLWLEDKGYYADWISRSNKLYDSFLSDGNVLAVVFGLAGGERTRKIYDFIDEHHLCEIPIQLGYPGFPWWMNLYVRVATPFYSAKNIFGWIGPLAVLGRAQVGDKEGTVRDLLSYSKMVLKVGAVPEIVDREGNLVQGRAGHIFPYTAEKHFAWAAAMYLYMADQIQEKGILDFEIKSR